MPTGLLLNTSNGIITVRLPRQEPIPSASVNHDQTQNGYSEREYTVEVTNILELKTHHPAEG